MMKNETRNESIAPENAEASELPRYVRVRKVVRHRFVEFDFAIGDPSLYVELVLPLSVFQEFCTVNNVIYMTEEQAEAVDKDMEKWRYGSLGRH